MQAVPERVLVTGGTGTTGSRVALRLSNLGLPVSVGTRRPAANHEVRFDWADPSSAAAFEGAQAAYLVAPTDRTDHLALMQPILERAIARGTRRFVLLSSSQFARGGPMMGEVHAWLADNAPEWAVLRPSWFMQNFSCGPHGPRGRESDDGSGVSTHRTRSNVVSTVCRKQPVLVALARFTTSAHGGYSGPRKWREEPP